MSSITILCGLIERLQRLLFYICSFLQILFLHINHIVKRARAPGQERKRNNDGSLWTHQVFAKLSPAKGNTDPFDTPATSQGVHYDKSRITYLSGRYAPDQYQKPNNRLAARPEG
jgi:hypothetical protein